MLERVFVAFFKRKNKIKALYGYWTHCVYSCDPRAYDELVKSGKPLPMVKLDEYFNEVGTPSTINSARHNHSDPSMHNASSSDNVANESNGGFNLNESAEDSNFYRNKISPDLDKNLSKDVQRKLSLKRNEPGASTFASFPTSSSNAQLPADLFEVWRVVPRPTYASEVLAHSAQLMRSGRTIEPHHQIRPNQSGNRGNKNLSGLVWSGPVR